MAPSPQHIRMRAQRQACPPTHAPSSLKPPLAPKRTISGSYRRHMVPQPCHPCPPAVRRLRHRPGAQRCSLWRLAIHRLRQAGGSARRPRSASDQSARPAAAVFGDCAGHGTAATLLSVAITPDAPLPRPPLPLFRLAVPPVVRSQSAPRQCAAPAARLASASACDGQCPAPSTVANARNPEFVVRWIRKFSPRMAHPPLPPCRNVASVCALCGRPPAGPISGWLPYYVGRALPTLRLGPLIRAPPFVSRPLHAGLRPRPRGRPRIMAPCHTHRQEAAGDVSPVAGCHLARSLRRKRIKTPPTRVLVLDTANGSLAPAPGAQARTHARNTHVTRARTQGQRSAARRAKPSRRGVPGGLTCRAL